MLRDGLSGDEVYLLDALDLGDGFDDLLLFASWKAPVRKQEVVVDLIIFGEFFDAWQFVLDDPCEIGVLAGCAGSSRVLGLDDELPRMRTVRTREMLCRPFKAAIPAAIATER